jgi:hypothetical protein
MIVHLTARTSGGVPALSALALAAWLWDALRRGFPDAFAAVLMPTHCHVVAVVPSANLARVRLARILGAANRRCRPPGAGPVRWEPVPAPTVVAGRQKLARDVRYVVMNPCRARLVRDPLEWQWTTHRDVLGAVADPWVTASKLARALEQPVDGFGGAFHRYVSGDPSCDARGTLPPRAAPAVEYSTYPLQRLAAAALAATRATPGALRERSPARAAFVLLAARQGWNDAEELARRCAVTRGAIYRLWQRDEPALIAAASLCLGDDRLVKPWLAAAGVVNRPNAAGRAAWCMEAPPTVAFPR